MKNSVQPKTKEELWDIIQLTIKEDGNKANLNFIDTSNITDMSNLFNESKFNGNISKWDVSNVTNMSWMFNKSKFSGDISKWNVSKVKDMTSMFHGSKFNKDISKWNVSKVKDMTNMFQGSKFNKDISKWNVSKVKYMTGMFGESQFNGDICSWGVSVSNVKDMYNEYTNLGKYKEAEYFWYIDRYFHKDTNEVFLEFYDGIYSLSGGEVYVGDGISIGP